MLAAANKIKRTKAGPPAHFDGTINRGTAADPKYTGELNPNDLAPSHEGGHFLGLGDDYYEDTLEAVPGHEGHLMATGKDQGAAQDEIDRLAGYILSTGKSTGTIIQLPGSKSSTQRTYERIENEKKKP